MDTFKLRMLEDELREIEQLSKQTTEQWPHSIIDDILNDIVETLYQDIGHSGG